MHFSVREKSLHVPSCRHSCVLILFEVPMPALSAFSFSLGSKWFSWILVLWNSFSKQFHIYHRKCWLIHLLLDIRFWLNYNMKYFAHKDGFIINATATSTCMCYSLFLWLVWFHFWIYCQKKYERSRFETKPHPQLGWQVYGREVDTVSAYTVTVAHWNYARSHSSHFCAVGRNSFFLWKWFKPISQQLWISRIYTHE